MGQADEQNYYYQSTPRPAPMAVPGGRAPFRRVHGGWRNLGAVGGAAPGRARHARGAARSQASGLRRLGSQRRPVHLRLRLRDVHAGKGRRRRGRAPPVGRGHRGPATAARADRAACHRLRLHRRAHGAGAQAASRRKPAGRAGNLATRYDYHSLRFIERDELRTLIASERYSSALFDSNGGHLQPYRYTLGLGRAAESIGVSIFENSWVTRLDVARHAGADSLAHTAQGTVRARHLLIAGGALLGRLVPSLAEETHGHRHLHRRHAAARRRAGALADLQQCGGRRHELDPGLLPPSADHRCCSADASAIQASIPSTRRRCCARASRRCFRNSPMRASNMPGVAFSTSP